MVAAAGIASSFAQGSVYSVNVVGYVTKNLPAGFSMIANPLVQTDTKLATLIPAPPANTVVYTFDNVAGYSVYIFDEFDSVWTPDGNAPLSLGEGFFINAPSQFPVTFVGEVAQGKLTNNIPTGFTMKSSMVPQTADVNALGFPAAPNDVIYKFDNVAGYSVFIFDEFDNVWTPSVPVIDVGEAFFVNKAVADKWIRDFTVN